MYKHQEYPKMIYKGGDHKAERMIVYDKEQEMTMLEVWGDKRPDNIAKPVAKPVEVKDNDVKEVEADSAPKAEEKPRRKKRKKVAKAAK
jgi:hypothetical protein